MALNGDTLGQAIWDAIKAEDFPETENEIRDMWKTIATAIVDHIKNNAEVSTNVSTTVAVDSVSNVTPGVGDSGPGSGSGSGSGTGTIT